MITDADFSHLMLKLRVLSGLAYQCPQDSSLAAHLADVSSWLAALEERTLKAQSKAKHMTPGEMMVWANAYNAERTSGAKASEAIEVAACRVEDLRNGTAVCEADREMLHDMLGLPR